VDSYYDQDCEDDLEANRKSPGKGTINVRETKVLDTRQLTFSVVQDSLCRNNLLSNKQ